MRSVPLLVPIIWILITFLRIEKQLIKFLPTIKKQNNGWHRRIPICWDNVVMLQVNVIHLLCLMIACIMAMMMLQWMQPKAVLYLIINSVKEHTMKTLSKILGTVVIMVSDRLLFSSSMQI